MMRTIDLRAIEPISASSSRACSRRAGSRPASIGQTKIRRDSFHNRGAGGLGQRCGNEIDAQRALVERPRACSSTRRNQQSVSSPTRSPTRVEEGDIWRKPTGFRSGSGAVGRARAVVQTAPKTARDQNAKGESSTPILVPAVGEEPDQRLQGAVQQCGVKQVGVDILGDRRGVEMRERRLPVQRFRSGAQFETGAVIEPASRAKSIEGLGVDPTRAGLRS